MTITALPTTPLETQSRTDFNANVAAFLGALPTFISEMNADATTVASDAATASAAATSLATVKWVSGTTYADGDVRWDPTTRTSFRRMGAGAGTTTPSADSTNWKAQISLSNVWCGTATGTANALVLTPAIPTLAYVAGDSYRFKSSASANTAATTVAISGRPAIAIQVGGVACNGGEILANQWYQLMIDASLTSAQLTPVGVGYGSTPGAIISTGTGGIGYGTAAGGTVTQATSKTTAVTLNKICGRITMHNASLSAGASAIFQLNNSLVAPSDVVVATAYWGAVYPGSYRVDLATVASGLAQFSVTNVTGGSLSEALQINFAIIKGVTA